MLRQIDLIDIFFQKHNEEIQLEPIYFVYCKRLGPSIMKMTDQNVIGIRIYWVVRIRRAALNNLGNTLIYLNYLFKDRILCSWNVLDFSCALTDTASIRHFVTIRTGARIWTIIVSTRLSCNTGITQALIDI